MTDHQYDGQGIADALKEAFPAPEMPRPQYRQPLDDLSRAILQTRLRGMGDVPERARIYGLIDAPNPVTGRSQFTDEELMAVRASPAAARFFNMDGSLSQTGRFQLMSIMTNRG